jgi:hypothetical protein
MKTVFKLSERFGVFLSDGASANVFRFTEVEPAIASGHTIVLDFEGVTNMTDSFGNALIGGLVQNHPELLKSGLEFKNCNPLMRTLVSLAIQVAQMISRKQLA